MKSSFKKLRGFALNKSSDLKDKRENSAPAHHEELIQASQDMQEMRDCYDNLLSAAAATANSAYEFSESLQEMGDCLLKKTALNDDEESGRVLSMLGEVQFELQKLVNSYRIHIVQTITTPSESLLKELQTVEEMKHHCDDKRDLYKDMLAAQRDKGKTRSTKGETFSLEQVQAAKEDYEDEANLFVFRLKSLKQGQSRSLLTQAVRHHAAQLNLFRKGVKSLELVEPHVKMVAEQQHIDYQFSGLEDDYAEDDDENSYSYDGKDEGELTFDYRQNDQGQEVVSLSRNSMELDQLDNTNASSTTEILQEDLSRGQIELAFRRAPRPGSQSAPIFADKVEVSDRISSVQPSARKSYTYALPTPDDGKCFPCKPNEPVKDTMKEPSSPTKMPKVQSVLKESNTNSSPIKLPLPLVDASSLTLFESSHYPSDTKKSQRHAFSGPITSKTWSSKSTLSVQRPVPWKVSPSASPPRVQSPRISELHELPRPPLRMSAVKPTGPSSLIPHSAPLVSKSSQELDAGTATRRPSIASSLKASPLPTPPVVMARSYSIPSSGQRTPRLTSSTLFELPRSPDLNEDKSPPLTPLSLTSNQHLISEPDAQTTKLKGVP